MAKKKLCRGGYFTDIHFGAKGNSIQHNEDCLNYLKWFSNKVKEHNCDYVAFLGDWFENRSALNVQTLHYAYQGAKMVDDIGLPVYFVIGNHDLYYRHSRDIHSVVYHYEFENFTVIDKPIVVDEIKGKVFFCPYIFHDEYKELTKYLKIPFWAGHFEFKSFIVTGYNVELHTGPDAVDFSGPKHIVSGHFHKRQAKNNVVYIGNTFPTNFGDAGDTGRGMMIYDHNTDDMFFEDWEDAPQYIKTKLSDLFDDKLRKKILVPNARVKCLVDEPIEFEESNQLRQTFMEQHELREFEFEESPEVYAALADTETAPIDWDEEGIQSVDELVLMMLKNIDTDHIDSDMLIEIYKKLKVPTE